MIPTFGINTYEKTIIVRKCSELTERLKTIYDILKTGYKLFKKRKSVVHKLPLKEIETQQQQLLKLS